jgi:hypothetical protein
LHTHTHTHTHTHIPSQKTTRLFTLNPTQTNKHHQYYYSTLVKYRSPAFRPRACATASLLSQLAWLENNKRTTERDLLTPRFVIQHKTQTARKMDSAPLSAPSSSAGMGDCVAGAQTMSWPLLFRQVRSATPFRVVFVVVLLLSCCC